MLFLSGLTTGFEKLKFWLPIGTYGWGILVRKDVAIEICELDLARPDTMHPSNRSDLIGDEGRPDWCSTSLVSLGILGRRYDIPFQLTGVDRSL